MVSFYVEYKGGMKMKFLYRLYDQQYFGIILFVIIIALLLLFLIIFFFGKKDEKEQLEKTRKLELAKSNDNKSENTESFKEVDENTKELVIPEIEQPEIKEEVMLKPFNEIEEEKVEEIVPKEEIDINSLFELPKDEVVSNEPKEEINDIKIIEPIEQINEPTKIVDAPLSSVFTEPKEENNVPFEMPKLMEMPKLKTEPEKVEEKNNTLFGSEPQITNNIFDNIENETYEINERHL